MLPFLWCCFTSLICHGCLVYLIVDRLTLHAYKATVRCTRSFSKFFCTEQILFGRRKRSHFFSGCTSVVFQMIHFRTACRASSLPWFFSSTAAVFTHAGWCDIQGWHRTLVYLLVWWHQLPAVHLWRGACATHQHVSAGVSHICGTLHTSVWSKDTAALKRAGERYGQWCAIGSRPQGFGFQGHTAGGSNRGQFGSRQKVFLWFPWAGTSWGDLEGEIRSNFRLVGLLMRHRVEI